MDASSRKLIRIALFANVAEWYEFSIYSFLAGVIGELFFKTTHPILALIQTFGIFAASYLIRPVGSLIFGSLADRFGRSYTLKLSLMLMSIPTILIGVLPTYSSIDWLAPICLLTLRLIQGFGAGGEFPIISCYVYEAAQPQKRGIPCSSVIVSGSIGILCGSLVSTLLAWIFSPEEISSWAWRIPFLLGIPLTLYIFYIRQKLLEVSSASRKNTSPESKISILALFTVYKIQLLQTILLSAFPVTSYYLLAIWLPSYLVHFLGYSQKIVSLTNTLTLCSMVLLYLASGWLSNHIGYKKLMTWGIGLIFLSVYILFLVLQQQLSLLSLLGMQLLFGLFLSGIDPLTTQYLGDVFPRSIRASGMGVSLTLAASLFGGTAPFICTWLTHKTGLLTFPAVYIMFFALLALPVALRLKTGIRKETEAKTAAVSVPS